MFNHSFIQVLTYPEEVTRDACERIAEYCERRLRPCSHMVGAVPFSRQESRQQALDEGSEGDTLSNDLLSNEEESDDF
jgi:hypothetical protein